MLKKMQWFVANVAVTPSAIRGGREAVPGVRKAAVEFLSGLDLKITGGANSFPAFLDTQTKKLTAALPERARYWGRARECLNIFLRDASYNFLLRTTYGLDRLDEELETPLDSSVIKGLKSDAASEVLPRWTTIIALRPEDNEGFQAIAERIARTKYGTHRANLDLWYLRSV